MIGRLVLAALIAGMAAGVILSGIQHLRITPIILAAEVYEKAAEAAAPAVETNHDHDAMAWEPADGWQRALSTSVSTLLAGAGFALALAGISLLTGIAITPANGLIWGVCGFLAVTVATGAGLPPELPGMPAGDLMARQIWWVGTIAATGIGLYLIAVRRELSWIAVAVVLLALPHLIGAPQPSTEATNVPAGLAAAFAL